MLEWMSWEEPCEICVYTGKVFFAETTAAKVQLLYLEQGMERLAQISSILQRGGQLAQRLQKTPQGAASAAHFQSINRPID